MLYGLIFDVDGVIADTERLSEEATIAMFNELYDIEPLPEDFIPFIGTGAVRYIEGVADMYGIEVDIDKAVQKRTDNFLKILNSEKSAGLDGAAELANEAFNNSDWKVAVATSGPTEKSKASVRASNIDINLFDAYITGDMVTHLKPNPEIYIKAGNAIDISPDRCIVIEDAVNGIEAAKAAGMNCVAVTNSFGAEALQNADFVVSTLRDLNLDKLRCLITQSL